MLRTLICLCTVVAFLGASVCPRADEVLCRPTGGDFSGSHDPIWGAQRDSCSFTYTKPNGVEGWVRGWGKVNRDTGVVETVVELETDQNDKGPCGKADVELRGGGRQLAHIIMN